MTSENKRTGCRFGEKGGNPCPQAGEGSGAQVTADFLATLSHDLKTPVTIILNYSDMLLKLKKDRLDGDMEMMLNAIKEGSGSILRILDTLMARAKFESGSGGILSIQEDIAEILNELSFFYKGVAEGKGLNFHTDIQEGLPLMLIDGVSIKSAVSNLLHNAVSYTPKGGSVVLQARCEHSCSHVSVAVSDTGAGIHPGERPLIFEKFFSSEKPGAKTGSGVGLWIVKNVAEAHGGRIELESEPGRGSTFKMFIPVRQVKPD